MEELVSISSGSGELIWDSEADADLARIMRKSFDAFSAINQDPQRCLMAGFVAAFATAQLTDIGIAQVRESATSELRQLTGATLGAARARALRTADSRYAANRNEAGAIWHLLGNALLLSEAEKMVARERAADEMGAS